MGKNYEGVGYLTGRPLAFNSDHPNRVYDPGAVQNS
jgi:hypothetical protein